MSDRSINLFRCIMIFVTAIKPHENGELLLAMTNYRLMSIHPKRAPESQVANRLENTGLPATIFAVAN